MLGVDRASRCRRAAFPCRAGCASRAGRARGCGRRRRRRSPPRAAARLAAPRTSPCAHGQALMPHASTPTTRRTRSRRRGGDPDQRRDLLRRQPGHRRAALERVLRLDAHLGAQRVLALDDVRRDVLGERLDEERLADHDLRRSPPRRSRGTATCGRPSGRDRGRPCTRSRPRTSSRGPRAGCGSPSARRSRRRGSGRAGPRAAMPAGRRSGRSEIPPSGRTVARCCPTSSFPRVVSLACHDLRTPLATIYGFARTLTRADELDERIAALPRDDRGGGRADDRAARRARHGRAHPGRPLGAGAARGRHARARARPTTSASTPSATARRSRPKPTSSRAALQSLAVAAIRHGPVDQVTLARATAARSSSRRSPTAAAPVVTGEELRDLGSLVARLRARGARRLARARRRDAARPL